MRRSLTAAALAAAAAATRLGWPAMLDELDRSVAALPTPRAPFADMLARWDNATSVLIVGGRAYVGERFPDEYKRLHHLSLLASAHKLRPLPDVLYDFHPGSSGAVPPERLAGGLPPLVIAKRSGYAMPGVLVPNSYLAESKRGVVGWNETRAELHERAAELPWRDRSRAVFWRGMVRGHDRDDGPLCALDGGNYARLQAAALSYAHPEHVDVKCTHARHCRPGATVCPDQPRDATEALVAANVSLVSVDRSTPRRDYANYRFVLNLPGSTGGSYSRNLNHLWALGGVVMNWRAPFVEWYFPALEPGATHEEVDKRTLVDAVRAIEGDEKRIAKLVAGARRVDDDFFCSACLADYVGAVLDRVRARFYDDAFASRLRRSGGCAALGRLVEVDLAASFKLRDARPACRALAEP